MTEHEWQPDEIFVFGSNLLGIQGAGAALFAKDHCGAEMGVGEGLTGQSYALPTCSSPGVPLPLELVGACVRHFIDFAVLHPDRSFFLTRVGCGYAGFSDAEIAPFFLDAPSNIRKPPEWT